MGLFCDFHHQNFILFYENTYSTPPDCLPSCHPTSYSSSSKYRHWICQSASAYPMSICWRKLTFYFPAIIKHLSSWLSVQPHAKPPLDWDFVCLEFLKFLCMLTQSLGFHMCICPVVPQEFSSFMQPIPIASYSFFHPVLQKIFEVWGKRVI